MPKRKMLKNRDSRTSKIMNGSSITRKTSRHRRCHSWSLEDFSCLASSWSVYSLSSKSAHLAKQRLLMWSPALLWSWSQYTSPSSLFVRFFLLPRPSWTTLITGSRTCCLTVSSSGWQSLSPWRSAASRIVAEVKGNHTDSTFGA